jgi:hypothetical protein
MSSIEITYDTNQKTLSVQLDGQDVPNVSSVYVYGGDYAGVEIVTSEYDDNNSIMTRTSICGNEKERTIYALSSDSYAYVPDPKKPSTWKLRIDDARHVAGAMAALGPGGFRGNKVDIPEKDLPKVKAKVRAAWKKFNPDKSDDEMPGHIKSTINDVDDIDVSELGARLCKTFKTRQL